MKKTVLKKYAELIAKRGVNVQKGQEVIIDAEVDQPEFVYMVAEACYKLGAKKVVINLSYLPFQILHYRYRSIKTLGTLEEWEKARWQHYVDEIPCRIYLVSEDPEGLKHVSIEKIAKANQMIFPVIKGYRDQLENKYQWCIAAIPGVAWAKRLFPGFSKKQAVEKLWEAILTASRAMDDPIQAWDEHNADLQARCAYLNNLGIDKLHYFSKNGTDFTVGMIPEAEFKGGGDRSISGIFFNPNIPTEECFISPKRGEAEGIVYGSMPLSYQGQLIEGFSIRFKEGKAIEWHAEKNEELLEKMLTMDEGAGYLGECALVPFSSPIRKTGLLFYNTLFDENAACHFAVGNGFPDTIKDYENKTLEECRDLGVNDSMIHVDFMIGTEDLNITAICKNGNEVKLFTDGTWAF